ncbi:MAG: AraC family transcriptional regulator [Breznakibacter sp.]
MSEKVYLVFTVLFIGTTLGFGLCFLFLGIPKATFLNSYKLARRAMACAYIVLSILNMLEIIIRHDDDNDIRLAHAITLIIGAFQAFLFTYTFICLINSRYVTKNKIILETIPITLLGIAVLATYINTAWSAYFKGVYNVFLIYYLFVMVRYPVVFLKEFRNYTLRADNYFSEQETARFKWIYYSFFAFFAIGVVAMGLTFTANEVYYVCFTVALIAFYSYFGIKFIDYAFRYQYMEPVAAETGNPQREFSFESTFEPALNQWIDAEKFLQPGLTVEQLARELNTNRTYLSNYINHVEQKTFRTWINDLKIDKSKEILLAQPNLPVMEVASIVGYNDGSNFNKQFVKNTGVSAQAWRMQNMKKPAAV